MTRSPRFDWPRITIVTPTKNSGKYLEETIKSVLEQDYPNLEYIIVDGQSTDGTLDIIEKYEKHLAHWESGPDRTMYEAIVKGFKRATGEIFAWLNSDDIYEPGALEKVGKHFSEHPDHQVIYFEDTVEKEGWRIPNRPQPWGVGLGELLGLHILYQDGVFFRRSAYEAVGGLDASFKGAGDYDLWLRLSGKFRFHRCGGHVSCFRIRPGQISITDWGGYMEEIKRSRERYAAGLSPLRIKKAEFEAGLRRRANRLLLKFRRRLWPLRNESAHWAPVVPPESYSVRDCRCPVCGSSPYRLLFSTPDTRFGDRKLWRVYECRECNASFTFPRPDASTLRDLYEKTYSGEIKGVYPAPAGYYSPYRGKTLCSRRPIAKLRRAFPFLHRKLGLLHDDIVPIDEKKDALILDLGCFEGRILEHLRALGYRNLFGVELNRKAAEAARSKGFEINTEDVTVSDWPHRPLDAIILNQVLEHTGDPVGFLASVKRLLKPGGRVYLSVPNFDSAFVDFYGPAWAHWHIPYHFFTPSPRTMKKLAEKAGLGVQWMRTSTPIHYAYMSEELSRVGIGGYVSHFIDTEAPGFRPSWERAKGVTVLSWLLLDRLLRGDCLYAKLIKGA